MTYYRFSSLEPLAQVSY